MHIVHLLDRYNHYHKTLFDIPISMPVKSPVQGRSSPGASAGRSMCIKFSFKYNIQYTYNIAFCDIPVLPAKSRLFFTKYCKSLYKYPVKNFLWGKRHTTSDNIDG